MAGASPDQSDPIQESRRSRAAADPALASSQASCAYSPAATKTGTSSTPPRGSTRISGLPYDGCFPRQRQDVGRRYRLPGRAFPADPQRDQPSHWTVFTPPAPTPRRRSWPNFSPPYPRCISSLGRMSGTKRLWSVWGRPVVGGSFVHLIPALRVTNGLSIWCRTRGIGSGD